MKAKVLIVCLQLIGLTAFAGHRTPSFNITYIKRPYLQTITIDEVDKNFFLPGPHNGLKPTVASGNTTNFIIHKFYNSKYSNDIPSDFSTISKETVTGIMQKNKPIQR